jgi:beta-glucosidase-like glycosyl hydrolase
MVATWDAELIGRESDVISTGARAKYNEATRHGIHSINYGFTLRTIFGNTYLPAFRATITEAKADSIMCAYNAIDKSPACANQQLLNTIPGERLSHIL